MTFSGFPPELFDFFAGIEADNSKAYWEGHRPTYETAVREPMKELAAELETRVGPVHFFRPYRDVRFSKDKRPYQEHASLHAGGEGNGLYLSVGVEGMMLGGGYWRPAKDQIERWRQAVDDNASGTELERLLKRLEEQGFSMGHEPSLKRIPRGYPPDHPRENLMRRTDFTVGKRYPVAQELHGPQALDMILEGWQQIQVWNGWLRGNVGPSQEETDGRRHG